MTGKLEAIRTEPIESGVRMMALNDLQIRALKATDRIYKKADAGGLYIEVHPSGSKLWRVKYVTLRKEKRLAIGRYPEVSLAEAREKREEARKLLAAGSDPTAIRRRWKPKWRLKPPPAFERSRRSGSRSGKEKGSAMSRLAK